MRPQFTGEASLLSDLGDVEYTSDAVDALRHAEDLLPIIAEAFGKRPSDHGRLTEPHAMLQAACAAMRVRRALNSASTCL